MHIHTRHNRLVECLLDIFRCSVQVVNVFNVHPVAHDKSLESPFSPQDILHKPFVRMARDAVELVVGGH